MHAPRVADAGRSIEPIRFVFPPDAASARFVEQPEDRAEAENADADLWSNVDARARDPEPGGDDDAPRLAGEAEWQEIPMTLGEPEPSATAPRETEPTPPVDETGTFASLREALLRDAVRGRNSPETPRVAERGNSDLPQPEGSFTDAGARLSGDITLSTTEWEYAPWLTAFRRAVFARWHAPSAYYLGMIDGWTHLELRIGRDGRLQQMRVVEGDVGHRSLEEAAVYAVNEAAPYLALPDHFPDETLVLQIRFVYPRLRR